MRQKGTRGGNKEGVVEVKREEEMEERGEAQREETQENGQVI